MNRTIIHFTAYFMTLLFILASCSKDIADVSEKEMYPIGFNNVSLQSKASVTGENIATEGNSFSVYGYYTLNPDAYDAEDNQFKSFNPNPVEVTYSKTKGWSYENTQYWITGGAYSFMAYFPAEFPADISENYPSTSFKNFQIESKQSDQVDILACQVKRKTEDIFVPNGDIVSFQFKHLLSNVCISLRMADGYQGVIKAVALNNVALRADCEYSLEPTPTITWSNHDATTTVGDNKDNVVLINKPDNPETDVNDSEYVSVDDYFGGDGIMVIPEAITENVLLYIVTTMTVLNEDNITMDKTFEIQLPAGTVWEAGKRYTYEVELSFENNIKIGTPGVEPWNPGSFGGTILIM